MRQVQDRSGLRVLNCCAEPHAYARASRPPTRMWDSVSVSCGMTALSCLCVLGGVGGSHRDCRGLGVEKDCGCPAAAVSDLGDPRWCAFRGRAHRAALLFSTFQSGPNTAPQWDGLAPGFWVWRPA